MENTNDLTFEKAYAALEETVDRMNAASVPLDELMKLYEQGMELAARCEKLLSGYEARLEKVSKAALAEAAAETAQELPEETEDDEEAPF